MFLIKAALSLLCFGIWYISYIDIVVGMYYHAEVFSYQYRNTLFIVILG